MFSAFDAFSVLNFESLFLKSYIGTFLISTSHLLLIAYGVV